MPFAEDQDMIQAVAPKCPDQALNISLAKDAPTLHPVHAVGSIRPRPILGGLHHQYIRL
jgi:hypothetical protein